MHTDPVAVQYRFPRPLASAFMRMRRSGEDATRLGHQLAFEFELVRFVTLAALADYLAGGARDSRVEALLSGLVQPGPVEWVELLCALRDALAARDTAPFLRELVDWLGDDTAVGSRATIPPPPPPPAGGDEADRKGRGGKRRKRGGDDSDRAASGASASLDETDDRTLADTLAPDLAPELAETLEDIELVVVEPASIREHLRQMAETCRALCDADDPWDDDESARRLDVRHPGHERLLDSVGFLANYVVCSLAPPALADAPVERVLRWRGPRVEMGLVRSDRGWRPARRRPYLFRAGYPVALALYPLVQVVGPEDALGGGALAFLSTFSGRRPRYGAVTLHTHHAVPVFGEGDEDIDVTAVWRRRDAWFHRQPFEEAALAVWCPTGPEVPPGVLPRASLELVAPIACGPDGVVYRGRDHDSGEDVAVRVVHPMALVRDDTLPDLLQRVQARMQVQHPSLVRILGFEASEEGGGLLLLSEAMDGGSLAELLVEAPLPARQALDLAIDVLGALGALHHFGYVHNAIHPEGVQFTTDGFTRLADVEVPPRLRAGRPDLPLPPETVTGAEHGAAADQFMVAHLLYQMLTGEPPDVPRPVPPSHTVGHPSASIDAAVLRALSADPADRFPQVSDFRAALEEARDGLPVESHDQPPLVVSYLRYLNALCWSDRLSRLRDAEQWVPLLTVHRERVRVEADRAARLQALTAAAAVAEEGLGDAELSASLWEHVFRLSPGDPRASENLERLLPRIGRTHRLLMMLEDAVRAEPTERDRRIDLDRRLARLHMGLEGHGERAANHWRAVLERQPGDQEALSGLVSLSQRIGVLRDPSGDLARLLETATSEEEWLAVAERLACYWSTERYDGAASASLWKEILERRPRHQKALYHLARIRRLEGDWRGYAAILAERIKVTEAPAERAALRRELARVSHQELDDNQGAIDALKLALAEVPSEEQPAVRDELERLYRAGARWRTLVDLLLTAYESEPPGPRRIDRLLALAEIFCRRLDAPHDALTTLQRAMLDAPHDPRARFGFWRLAEKQGAWELFCDVVEETIGQMAPIDGAEYGARASRAAWFQLGDAERTRRLALLTLDRHPGDRLTLTLLVEASTQLERWEDLVRALERVKDLDGDAAAEARFHLQLARIFEDHIGDIDQAVARAEDAHRAAPADVEPLVALVRLLGVQERWEEQETVLLELADRHPRGEAFRLLVLAKLYKQKLERVDDALEAARRALEADPSASDGQEALRLLVEVHRARKEWPELADALALLVDHELPTEERADLLEELATLEEEQLARPAEAISRLRRVVELAPSRTHARESLLRLTAERADDESRAAALRAAAAAATDPVERRTRLFELADLLYERLGRPDDALDVLDHMAEEGAGPNGEVDDEALLSRRAAWHRGLGDHVREERDVEALGRIAEKAFDRAVWKTRLAELQAARGETNASLLPLLRDATSDAPHCDEAQAALVARIEADGDPEALAEALVRWAADTRDEERRAHALVQLADVRLGRGERGAARAALEAALEARPDHVSAAKRLLRLSIEDQRWERCPPLVQVELDHLPPGAPPSERAGLHRLAGDIALRLGDPAGAVHTYERSLVLAPRNAAARRGLAVALRKVGRLEDARRAWTEVLEAPREELSSDVVAEAHRAIEEIDRTRGEHGRSLEHLERALAQKPDDADLLRSVLPIYEQRGDWEKAVAVRRKLVDRSTDALARFNHLLAVGAALLQHLESPGDAAAAYKAALVIQPDSQAARLGLLDAQLAAHDWDGGAATLEALVKAADTPARKASFQHTLAVLHRDHRDDETAAIKHFNAALDLDPERLQSFADLDALLARRGDPSTQARSYKRMLMRVSGRGDRDIEHRLWYNLGQLYANHLDRRDDAITALEEAVQRAPDALEPRRLLARMLDDEPTARERAIAQHRQLLRYLPRGVASYQALRRHFAELRHFDAAWCAAGVLGLLGAADATEKAFYNRFRTGSLQVGGQSLALSEWPELVMVPEEEQTVGELFALLAEHLGGELHGARPKDHGLTARDQVDVEAEDGTFRDLYRAVVRMLGGPSPAVYRRKPGTGIRTAALRPPVVLVGDDLFTSHQGKLVRFELAKALAFHHPWHTLTANLPVAGLRGLLEVAVRFTLPEASDANADEEGRRLLRHLRRRLASGDIQHLNELGHRLKSLGPVDDTLARWLRAVERTTNHIGLLLANDIEVAVQCVRREQWSAEHMPLEEQVDDLLRYAVSDEYVRLRKRVGIQIR